MRKISLPSQRLRNCLQNERQTHNFVLRFGRARGGGKSSDTLQKSGRIIEFQKIDYRRNVMSAMRWTNDWIRESIQPNQEYLFLIENENQTRREFFASNHLEKN